MEKERVQKVKYDLFVFVDEKGEEQKLERFICPRCGYALNKKNYYSITCPICYQRLEWNKL